jgi:hypothetical protein
MRLLLDLMELVQSLTCKPLVVSLTIFLLTSLIKALGSMMMPIVLPKEYKDIKK